MSSETLYYRSEDTALRNWDSMVVSLTDEEKNTLAGIRVKKHALPTSQYLPVNRSAYSQPFPLFGDIPSLTPYVRPPELSTHY